MHHNPYVVTLKKGMKNAKIVGLDKIIGTVSSVQADTSAAHQWSWMSFRSRLVLN